MKKENRPVEWDKALEDLLENLKNAYREKILKSIEGQEILENDEYEINLIYDEILIWLRDNRLLPAQMRVSLITLIDQAQVFKKMRIVSEETISLEKERKLIDKMKVLVDENRDALESHYDTINLLKGFKKDYDDYTEKLRERIKKINVRLRNPDIRYSFYYKDYQDIKADVHNKKYNEDERNWANNLGIDSFVGWKYAFYVLVYRNYKESHFRRVFKDKEYLEINIADRSSIEWFFDKFHNAYSVWLSRKLHPKAKKNNPPKK